MLVKFEVYFDNENWCARGIGVDIFTQGTTVDEVVENIKEAVKLHFEEEIQTGEEIRILFLSEFKVKPFAKAASY
ncbi:MAG: type II toxin-antitoxin system HicB family antitoxin [Candidatus Ranarchaeia archaeon]